MREKVVKRFLKYVTFDTTANPNNSNCPSSEGQRVFANYLVEELKSLGLEDAHVDENIAYDLLSAHLSLRDYYKYGGRKFYTIESLFLFLTKKGKLNKFAKNIDSDSVFFAWLYFLGKAEEVAQWKKKVDEIDNYVENKKGEY